MQMNPCPFCHEPNRLGVVVKQLRTGEPGYVHYGAYARCKKCKARGPLVRLDTKFDVRNERVGRDGRRTLIDLAVDAWNAVAAQPQGTDGLPLFENTTKSRDIDLSNIHAVCFGCAGLLGFEQKDKVIGAWTDECGVCHQYKPCTDLWHDWKLIMKGESK